MYPTNLVLLLISHYLPSFSSALKISISLHSMCHSLHQALYNCHHPAWLYIYTDNDRGREWFKPLMLRLAANQKLSPGGEDQSGGSRQVAAGELPAWPALCVHKCSYGKLWKHAPLGLTSSLWSYCEDYQIISAVLLCTLQMLPILLLSTQCRGRTLNLQLCGQVRGLCQTSLLGAS